MTRIFDAPRALVYQAWTEARHCIHWCAPRGYTLTEFKQDLRVGGAYLCSIRNDAGDEFHMTGVYREVVANERLVSTFNLRGQDPAHEMVVTVTFADAGKGTKLTLHQAVFQTGEGRDAHESGMTSCFEALAAYLKRLSAGAQL